MSAALALTMPPFATTLAPLRFFGRHHANSSLAQFDWVGSGFTVKLSGTGAVRADMDGGDTKFAILLDGEQPSIAYLTTRDREGRRLVDLANATGGVSTLTLLKATEPFGDQESSNISSDRPVSVFGLDVDPGVTLAPANDAQARRVDFYGDSDSAAFGVDGSASEPAMCAAAAALGFGFENFEHGWIRGVTRALGCDSRVQAVSGIGVVRDAGGTGVTMPALVRRTLQTVAVDDYAPREWRPAAVVLYIGSNDYAMQHEPLSEDAFVTAYAALVESILRLYEPPPSRPGSRPSVPPPPPIPVLHVCGGEPRPCLYISRYVARSGNATTRPMSYTTTGDTGVRKGGCVGHRNATQQARLARFLAPKIALVAGWGDGEDAVRNLALQYSELSVARAMHPEAEPRRKVVVRRQESAQSQTLDAETRAGDDYTDLI